jgi:hypothetical protein
MSASEMRTPGGAEYITTLSERQQDDPREGTERVN